MASVPSTHAKDDARAGKAQTDDSDLVAKGTSSQEVSEYDMSATQPPLADDDDDFNQTLTATVRWKGRTARAQLTTDGIVLVRGRRAMEIATRQIFKCELQWPRGLRSTLTRRDRSSSHDAHVLQDLVAEPARPEMHQPFSRQHNCCNLWCCRVSRPILRVYHVVHKTSQKWRCKTLDLGFDDFHQAEAWHDGITSALALLRRPKRLRVFVNPVSGKKQAVNIFRKTRFLYQLAGVSVRDTITTHAGHCQEIIDLEDLSSFDGVVLYGGDGLFHEAVQAILRLPLQRRPAVGLVPAGSTNASHATCYWTDDPTTCLIQILFGYEHRLDVGHVTLSPSVGEDSPVLQHLSTSRYIINQASYGFLSETVTTSEKMRCLGPIRYDLAGALAFLRQRSYRVRVAYRPLDLRNQVVIADNRISIDRTGSVREETKTVEGDFSLAAVATNPLINAKSKQGLCPQQQLADGTCDLVLVLRRSRFSMLRFLLRVAGKSDQYSLSNAVALRCTQVQFEVIGGTNADTTWNVDGEIWHGTALSCQIMQAALCILARGLPEGDPVRHK